MEAAARLFREKGYTATSMRDLAQAVDLKASSLYNHISGKEGLLREICFNNAHRFHRELDQIEIREDSAEAKVRALIHLHIQVATEDITSITAFNDEWRHLTEPHLSEFIAQRKSYESRFRSIIEAGMKDGSFKVFHANIALYTIFSAIRWIYDWYQPGKSISMEQLEEEISGLLLNGLNADTTFQIL
ncbi:TetR family transcriptional regulator [Flavilitoribacter nigricans DSM 23189 = NBRC 102662]|uniref:TetR family transcriptional regulator n=1 Tax=Flavilitoribacter nigricans (strain ATCC 23147 / DSM 23189 / NBRC 102662 / NCIMB 1420 / SS-2) TaxID=1122177 RepID=A0A2D0NIK8_FLAN2|nr:TetR family transcriptional regulator [Flavilitoribacter nigricans DSM 23189 = NBRC 102662]